MRLCPYVKLPPLRLCTKIVPAPTLQQRMPQWHSRAWLDTGASQRSSNTQCAPQSTATKTWWVMGEAQLLKTLPCSPHSSIYCVHMNSCKTSCSGRYSTAEAQAASQNRPRQGLYTNHHICISMEAVQYGLQNMSQPLWQQAMRVCHEQRRQMRQLVPGHPAAVPDGG